MSFSNPRSGRRPHGSFYRSILSERFRATLALGLALVLCLSFFNLSALAAPAQEQSEDGATSKHPIDEFVNDGRGYVVNQVNGVAVCRDATLEELRQMNRRDPNLKLRPINHPELFRNQPRTGGAPNEIPDLGPQNISSTDQGGEETTTTGTQSALEPSAGLVIIVRATARLEANPAAKDAVIRAANHWEAIIQTPITVVLDVDFGPDRFGNTADPFGPHTLASTSGGSLPVISYSSFRSNLIAGQSNADETALYAQLPAGTAGLPTDLPNPNVTDILLDRAVARALGRLGANAANDPTTSTQPSIGFNSTFTFDLDPSNGISSGQTDFDSVATHEIGHALGFSSEAGAGIRTLTSSNNTTRDAYLAAPWDIFRFKPSGAASLSNFATLARVMSIGTSKTDLQLAFFGPNAPQPGLSTGGPDPEATTGDGNQSSHWKADEQSGTYWGIMDPTIASGQRYFITDNDKRALDFMGYRVTGISSVVPAPANNNFANAQAITGCSGSVTGSNVGANKETGEHNHGGNSGGASIWYQWTAPGTGSVTITTLGSSIDTTLAAFTGNTLPTTSTPAIIENDDVDDVQGQPHQTYSTITFGVTAGTTYKIAVDGFDGATGNITLNWNASNCGVTPTPTPTPVPTPTPTPVPTPTTPAAIGFMSTGFSAFENSPSGINIPVNRTGGDISSAASVDYFTSDNSGLTPCQTNTSGNASDRCDYATAVGTLRFAPGENLKIIQIPLIADNYQELSENFTLTLRNAQGGSLGAISTMTVTILDDDAQPATTNPINDQGFFIKQQYIDFLGRIAEPAGFDFWMDRMTNCPTGQICDRTDTAKRFFESDEFKERGFYVYKLYDAVLGRPARYAEFVPDVARLNGPQTVTEQRLGKDAYLLDLINKTEFRNIYGQYISANGLTATNAAGFVNELCNRAGITPASKQTLINNLQSGARTPAQTLEDFILTPEISDVGTKFYDRAIITMQYFGFLRRDPDTAGFNFWWDRLANPQSPVYHDYREIVGNFLQADEYCFRFAFTH